VDTFSKCGQAPAQLSKKTRILRARAGASHHFEKVPPNDSIRQRSHQAVLYALRRRVQPVENTSNSDYSDIELRMEFTAIHGLDAFAVTK
jgi:hypothetical protein